MSDSSEVCFGLTCFSCGKTTPVIASRNPQFAFELAQAAIDVGMYGVFDLEHGRSLVFCNKQCADHQRKKNGQFRLRPKKAKT